jgi:adenosylmethionine-8-amino-7-oxononanoate aminotransferase
VACAAALAVQKIMKRDRLVEQVKTRGDYFERRLREKLGAHPYVGDIRGRGLFRGVELVEDRASKRPFDPKLKVHAKVKAAAMHEGLMCYPMGGTIDGERGDHVLLAPPFITTEAELDEIVNKLATAIEASTAALQRAA